MSPVQTNIQGTIVNLEPEEYVLSLEKIAKTFDTPFILVFTVITIFLEVLRLSMDYLNRSMGKWILA